MPFSNGMKVYSMPPIYHGIHVGTGFATAWFPLFGWAVFAYHMIQYALNQRWFVFEQRIEKGNTLSHTSFKLTESVIGYLIGMIAKTISASR